MRLFALTLLAVLCAAPSHVAARDGATPVALQAPVFVARVDGDFELDAQGRVTGYHAVTPAPADIVTAVGRFVRGLRFRMDDDDGHARPRAGRIRLTLLRDIVAGGAGAAMRVDNVLFPVVPSMAGTERLTPVPSIPVHRVSPRYPALALQRGVRARVLASVLVGEDGTTERVIIRQVSLRAVQGEPKLLARMASDFEARSLEALQKWTYAVSGSQGARRSAEDRTGMVPILFTFDDIVEKPFQWTHETRTAIRDEPWLEPDGQCCRMGVSDAPLDGSGEQVSDRFELLDDPRGRAL